MKNCKPTIKQDVQSRLDIIENIIHLIKTQNENQQEEIRQLKDEIQHIKSVVEVSTDRLSQILLPMDSKILEQTKKIDDFLEMNGIKPYVLKIKNSNSKFK